MYRIINENGKYVGRIYKTLEEAEERALELSYENFETYTAVPYDKNARISSTIGSTTVFVLVKNDKLLEKYVSYETYEDAEKVKVKMNDPEIMIQTAPLEWM